jgi:putative phage-type endonuclease
MMNPEDLQMRPVTDAWIENRCNYLGGTDIAAILEVHPYKTSLGVYLDKKGLKPPVELNQAMVHGQNLELYVAQCYRAATGRQIHKSKFYQDKEFPFFAANPDYEVRGERPLRLVECKTASYFAGQIFGSADDAVPDQYLIQCMWQLAITGRQVCDLAVLIAGQDFRIYTIERDEELIKTLRDRACEWWETYILSDTPPPLSGDKPDTEWVNSQHPQDNGLICYATPEIDDICVALREAKAVTKAMEREEDRLINLIKADMGDSGTLECSIGKITWKTSANGSRRFVTNFKEKSICQPQLSQQVA